MVHVCGARHCLWPSYNTCIYMYMYGMSTWYVYTCTCTCKASHLYCMCMTCSMVTPAQLMRPGIGRNTSCTLISDWLTCRPVSCSQSRELLFTDSLMYIPSLENFNARTPHTHACTHTHTHSHAHAHAHVHTHVHTHTTVIYKFGRRMSYINRLVELEPVLFLDQVDIPDEVKR